jgi:hypothetical protein
MPEILVPDVAAPDDGGSPPAERPREARCLRVVQYDHVAAAYNRGQLGRVLVEHAFVEGSLGGSEGTTVTSVGVEPLGEGEELGRPGR